MSFLNSTLFVAAQRNALRHLYYADSSACHAASPLAYFLAALLHGLRILPATRALPDQLRCTASLREGTRTLPVFPLAC